MKIYFDFDSTITNSILAVCEMYNERYARHKDFIPANASKSHMWNMKDVCPLAKDGEVAKMFSQKKSFGKMKMFDGAHDALKRLSTKHDITLVTVGTLQNIRFKADWVDKNLSDVLHHWHFVGGNTLRMDKSFINHPDGIIIDDHQGNLETANVPYKICAAMCEGDWNYDYRGFKAYNFAQIENAINCISKKRMYPKQPRKPKRDG